ncbi:MAG: hypothetical protein R3Y04_09730 [Rikenellaceae bacterium]
MERNIITISDSGEVVLPAKVQMLEFEIAQLFEVMIPTVRGCVKRLLNSRSVFECSGGIVRGNRIVPEYFGLEVVIAVAFQVDSYKADIFQKWVIRKLAQPTQSIYISLPNNQHCS